MNRSRDGAHKHNACGAPRTNSASGQTEKKLSCRVDVHLPFAEAALAEAAAIVSGQRSPIAWDFVTSDDADQASAADPSLLVASVVIIIFLIW